MRIVDNRLDELTELRLENARLKEELEKARLREENRKMQEEISKMNNIWPYGHPLNPYVIYC